MGQATRLGENKQQHGVRMQRHIAIVEDETSIRHNYTDALQRYGYRVSGYADR